jgi:hypothetical protein
MRNHSLFAAAAASFAVAGCAALPPGGKDHIQYQRIGQDSSSVCTSQNCKVEVVVTADCKAQARPYYLIMTGKAPVTVTWEVSKNASFVKEGVFFKEAEARKVFEHDARRSGEKQVTFRNGKQDGLYHYGVRVSVGDKVCPVLDPGVVNDMGVSGGPEP